MSTRRALLVANARYANPRLQQLRTPVHDVENLARALGDPTIGHFVVRDQLIDQPEVTVRRELSRFLLRARREDTLLVYVASHGLRDVDGQLYLAAADTDPDELPWTAIPAELVCGLMRRSPAVRVMLILDCCFSGAATAAMQASSAVDLGQFARGQGTGRVIITATSAEEYAWERSSDPFRSLNGNGGSVFCEELLKGLRTGSADLDGDGEISVGELYEYLRRTMAGRPTVQIPGLWSHLQSTFLIAHAPATPVRAAEAPGPADERTPSPWDATALAWRQPTLASLRDSLRTGAQTEMEVHGWRAIQLSDWSRAARAFAEAVDGTPGSLSAWWGHALARAAESEWETAADSFQQATDLAAAEAGTVGPDETDRRVGLLEFSASAALLGASCWAAVRDPRAADLIERALRIVPACPELLAYRAILLNDGQALSLAFSRHPELLADFRNVEADIFLAVREAALHAEARAGVVARARSRVDQVVAALQLPGVLPMPSTSTAWHPPEQRLAGYRAFVSEQRNVLAVEVGRLNAIANDLSGRAFDQEALDVVGAIRHAVGAANDALRYTDEPESIRARQIPARLTRSP